MFVTSGAAINTSMPIAMIMLWRRQFRGDKRTKLAPVFLLSRVEAHY